MGWPCTGTLAQTSVEWLCHPSGGWRLPLAFSLTESAMSAKALEPVVVECGRAEVGELLG